MRIIRKKRSNVNRKQPTPETKNCQEGKQNTPEQTKYIRLIAAHAHTRVVELFERFREEYDLRYRRNGDKIEFLNPTRLDRSYGACYYWTSRRVWRDHADTDQYRDLVDLYRTLHAHKTGNEINQLDAACYLSRILDLPYFPNMPDQPQGVNVNLNGVSNHSQTRRENGLPPKTLDSVYVVVSEHLTLDDAHADDLRRRGLDDCQTRRYGFRTLPPTRSAQRREVVEHLLAEHGEETTSKAPGFARRKSDNSFAMRGKEGLMIPVTDKDGLIRAWMIRSFDPQDETRYRFWSSYAAEDNERWHPGPTTGTPVHFPRGWRELADERGVIRVTEGALKATVAQAISETATIGLSGGIGNWKQATDAIKEAAGSERSWRISVAFDMERNKPQVRDAAANLIRALQADGWAVSLATWDDSHKGIDDALNTGLTITEIEGRKEIWEFLGLETDAPENEGREWEAFIREFPIQFLNGREYIFHRTWDKKGNEYVDKVCPRIDVVARTRDVDSDSWGRVLAWTDEAGKSHHWTLPSDLMQGDPKALFERLARGGIDVEPTPAAKTGLIKYIIDYPTPEYAVCAPSVGWCGNAYLLGEETISATNQKVYLQESSSAIKYHSKGTLDEWKNNLGVLAQGNALMIFAAGVSFAGPVLGLLDRDGGVGVNIHCRDSSGKTTIARYAASMWSNSRFFENWNATAKSIDMSATSRCHGLLYLDELSQANKRELAKLAFDITTQRSRRRLHRDGTQQNAAEHSVVLLSTANEAISGYIPAEERKHTPAGQVRIMDIDAWFSDEYKSFQNIHGRPDSKTFAKDIDRLRQRYYGIPIRRFIHELAVDVDEARDAAEGLIQEFERELVPQNADAAVGRVAENFGLFYAAACMASSLGIFPVEEDEIKEAIGLVFRRWIRDRGGATENVTATLCYDHVLNEIASKRNLHFATKNGLNIDNTEERWEKPRLDSWGFIDTEYSLESGRETQKVYIRTKIFRDIICKDMDYKSGLEEFQRRGMLETTRGHGLQKSKRFPGELNQPDRYYCLVFPAEGEQES